MNMEAAPQRVRTVAMLALGTLVVFGGLGWLLIVFVQQRGFIPVLVGSAPCWWHVVSGLLAGIAISAGAWFLITRPFLAPVRHKYADLIGPLMGSPWAQLGVSVCAGVGEELFFRGALQYWLGIPLTAIGFVALHGYLHPRDVRISAYGIYLTVAMCGLGWLAEQVGLLGPMIAHTLIDVFLLRRLVRDWRARTG